MYLGIEIGGTKLQLGIGLGDGSPLVELQRTNIDPAAAATGILAAIKTIGQEIDRTLSSNGNRHRLWRTRRCAAWPHEHKSSDRWMARFSASSMVPRHSRPSNHDRQRRRHCRTCRRGGTVFARRPGQSASCFTSPWAAASAGRLLIDGRIYTGSAGIAAEIGHLRPGLDAVSSGQTVESIASGFGAGRCRTTLDIGKFNWPNDGRSASTLRRSRGTVHRPNVDRSSRCGQYCRARDF